VYPHVSDTFCRYSQYELLKGNTFLFACEPVSSHMRGRTRQNWSHLRERERGNLLLHDAIGERRVRDPDALEREVDFFWVLVDVIGDVRDVCAPVSLCAPALYSRQRVQ
jgi:hypothetical protein